MCGNLSDQGIPACWPWQVHSHASMAKAKIKFGDLLFGFERAFNLASPWGQRTKQIVHVIIKSELTTTTVLDNKPPHHFATLRNADNHLSSHI